METEQKEVEGRDIKRKVILHPFFIALYPLFYIYEANVGKMSADELLLPASVLILACSVFFVVSRLILRESARAGYVTSVFVLIILFYSEASTALAKAHLIHSKSARSDALFLLAAGALLLAGSIAALIPRSICWPNTLLNAITGFMLALQIFNVAQKELSFKASAAFPFPELATTKLAPQKPAGVSPNIYYIVLDSFGRSDVFKELYGYDNSGFIEDLEKRGFFVAKQAHSNYCQTLLSVSSSLNMSYLDGLAKLIGDKSKRNAHIQRFVNDNEVVKVLRKMGYYFVSFSSGYSGTRMRDADDEMGSMFLLTEYQQLLLSKSPIPAILNRLPFKALGGWQQKAHRNRVQYILDNLDKVPDRTEPQFVFAHVMSPHPPFVFGENGELVNASERFSFRDGSHLIRSTPLASYRAGYRAQVTYISKEVIKTLDRLLAKDPGAIIVVQGDHGPGSELNWSSVDKTNGRERLAILSAFRVPSELRAKLNSALSPVNTFRLLFNYLFKSDYKQLPDESYYSPWKSPLHFSRVTDQVVP